MKRYRYLVLLMLLTLATGCVEMEPTPTTGRQESALQLRQNGEPKQLPSLIGEDVGDWVKQPLRPSREQQTDPTGQESDTPGLISDDTGDW